MAGEAGSEWLGGPLFVFQASSILPGLALSLRQLFEHVLLDGSGKSPVETRTRRKPQDLDLLTGRNPNAALSGAIMDNMNPTMEEFEALLERVL